MADDLKERIIVLETNYKHLKDTDVKLEQKIMELEDKIMVKLDELSKNHNENFKKIEEYMNKQKGGYSAIHIALSLIAGLIAAIGVIIKFFT